MAARGSKVTWTYTDEYYKQYTRDTWNESAEAYEDVLRNLDKYNGDLVAAVKPKDGERILDVATGPGEPAMTLAAGFPRAKVTGIDLAERMVEKARASAKSKGLENVAFEVMDAEAMEFPDASFDAIVCRFGLQIVTDPDKVIAEAKRLLVPGGRVGFTVWGPGERCPAIHVIIEPMLEHAEPDESGYLPTPYEMGGEGELAEMLKKAGFVDVKEERVTHSWTFPDEAAYFRATLEGTPIGHSLREEDEAVQREVLEKTRRNLEKWRTPEGFAMPSEAVVVTARRPA